MIMAIPTLWRAILLLRGVPPTAYKSSLPLSIYSRRAACSHQTNVGNTLGRATKGERCLDSSTQLGDDGGWALRLGMSHVQS